MKFLWTRISSLVDVNIRIYSLLVISGIFCQNRTASEIRVPDEHRLVRKLLRHYDRSVRPVYNTTDQVTVNFSLTLVQIMDMDEKNQVLVSKVWLEHGWIDQRIGWDPADYNNLRVLRIPADRLWLPDIVLYNSADDFTAGYMPTNVMIHNNGYIFWAPPARLRSSCKVDVTYFPFDEQTCLLKFGSWTYDQAQVDIVASREKIDMSNYITNGEWSYVGNNIVRNEVQYPIGPQVYPDVTVFVTIRRRILYYLLNIILPCVSLNLLSLLAFCLPSDAGEKVTLGITVLLSYSVFMLLVAENMPQTSEFVPLIGIYLTVSMAITSVSIILTVWILTLHHCGPHQSAVPRWVGRVVFGYLARAVGYKRSRIVDRVHHSKPDRLKTSSSKSKRNKADRTDNVDTFMRLVGKISTDCSCRSIAKAKSELYNSIGSKEHEIRRSVLKNCNKISTDVCSAAEVQTTQSQTVSSDVQTSIDVQRLIVMKEILRYLKLLVRKYDEDDRQNEITDEWRNVASVIDRCLFRIFLFITSVSTLAMMVVMPSCMQ